ncbi:MAG: nucleoside triphosphate pyrophosphohydrolase [Boseongicola sp.]|nr:MAG: nucleoside triphosphate pyrophosphohydrolase [Boseongicola sp.]
MTITTDPIGNTPDGLPRLLEVMRRLRDKDTGCPWDIEQDFASIAPYTIEEAYEVADAIERTNWPDLQGELGDLLLQVVYHSQMAEESGLFTFDDVAKRISSKMISRHPHVFGSENRNKSAEQQTADWEKAKAAERSNDGEKRTLDGVALGLPALMRALKLQKRLSRVGFDWGETGPVLEKLMEEIQELEDAKNISKDETEAEFGDLLFVMVNLSRHWGIDPEQALKRTNAKVERRFAAIEDELAGSGKSPADSTLDEMDALWNEIKAREK